MDRKGQIFLLILLMLALFITNYRFLDSAVVGFFEDNEIVIVERVIDGDTIVMGNQSVRLLGINSPEHGEFYFDEGKEFLEMVLLGKEVRLEFGIPRYDKYGRALAYVYRDKANVNLEMVEEGLANYYFYSGEDKYSEKLLKNWRRCLERNVNLCERSKNVCADCILIEDSLIVNECGFECDVSGWKIHGEGRKKFIFDGTLEAGGEKSFDLDLSNSGGSLFLRDWKGKLVEYIKG
jgi:hypothetical protein